MWTCSQRRSCARRRWSWRHLSLWQLITDEKADVSCAGDVTCSCVGGHGVCIRCRTCELCLPRLRWTLQHSSQINTPLFTEAQRGSEKEERKKNHKVKIMTLSAIWLMNHSRRKMLLKEQLKAKYLILWLARAWWALNSRGRVRWKRYRRSSPLIQWHHSSPSRAFVDLSTTTHLFCLCSSLTGSRETLTSDRRLRD